MVGGECVALREAPVAEKPFCTLLHFERDEPGDADAELPRVLVVAPMSGHHATLLRGTVQALLPGHDVYVTDWIDARTVPARSEEHTSELQSLMRNSYAV